MIPDIPPEKGEETIRYQYDLTRIKYATITSWRHDEVVQEIASDLGCNVQTMRKILMERVDMILLESVAPRYYTYTSGQHDKNGDIASILKKYLYTRVIPLVSEEQMNQIITEVQSMIDTGTTQYNAYAAGKKMRAEVIGL